ncbi:ankyrin repeat domain-containing protein 31-like isoform X1 [Erpetoichthys calabaricus]|uniref:ankyrin repeat domain-containing protein 31-like isoform X1 n=1 Tax=Erpetoichthys calabaricus TaxID=27687 RepID=UPI002234DA46|nr:ankyrin repeat domain-containing protein 31-like isoform X1 [Erpetoichthys calabaricus]
MSEEKKHFLYVSLSADKSCIKAIPPKTFSTRWMNRINIYGETKLHFAVKNEDIHLVRKLIKAGANVNKADYAGWTPLHEAVLSSHCEIVLELLKAGANINCKGYNGITPLQDAVQYDDYKMVKLLLEHDADAFAENDEGWSAWDRAICRSLKTVMYSCFKTSKNNLKQSSLKMQKNDPEKSLLRHLLQETFLSQKSIDNSSNVSDCEGTVEKSFEGINSQCTQLRRVEAPHEEFSVSLFAAQAMVIQKVYSPQLNNSVFSGDCASILSEAYIQSYNAVKRNASRQSHLHIAAINGDLALVKELFKRTKGIKNKINCTDCTGQTALHEASSRGYADIMMELLHNGADVNIRNKNWDLPLHLAVSNSYYKAVTLLLQFGSNPCDVNIFGKCAMDLAADDRIKQQMLSYSCGEQSLISRVKNRRRKRVTVTHTEHKCNINKNMNILNNHTLHKIQNIQEESGKPPVSLICCPEEQQFSDVTKLKLFSQEKTFQNNFNLEDSQCLEKENCTTGLTECQSLVKNFSPPIQHCTEKHEKNNIGETLNKYKEMHEEKMFHFAETELNTVVGKAKKYAQKRKQKVIFFFAILDDVADIQTNLMKVKIKKPEDAETFKEVFFKVQAILLEFANNQLKKKSQLSEKYWISPNSSQQGILKIRVTSSDPEQEKFQMVLKKQDELRQKLKVLNNSFLNHHKNQTENVLFVNSSENESNDNFNISQHFDNENEISTRAKDMLEKIQADVELSLIDTHKNIQQDDDDVDSNCHTVINFLEDVPFLNKCNDVPVHSHSNNEILNTCAKVVVNMTVPCQVNTLSDSMSTIVQPMTSSNTFVKTHISQSNDFQAEFQDKDIQTSTECSNPAPPPLKNCINHMVTAMDRNSEVDLKNEKILKLTEKNMKFNGNTSNVSVTSNSLENSLRVRSVSEIIHKCKGQASNTALMSEDFKQGAVKKCSNKTSNKMYPSDNLLEKKWKKILIGLIKKHVIKPGKDVLQMTLQDTCYKATLMYNGSIRFQNSQVFFSPLQWTQSLLGPNSPVTSTFAWSKVKYKDKELICYLEEEDPSVTTEICLSQAPSEQIISTSKYPNTTLQFSPCSFMNLKEILLINDNEFMPCHIMDQLWNLFAESEEVPQ